MELERLGKSKQNKNFHVARTHEIELVACIADEFLSKIGVDCLGNICVRQ